MIRRESILRNWPGRCQTARSTGFTLIELLIALAILAVLMALLLPAMARAREASRLVGCLSNLRQITLSTHAYADEFEGHLPFPKPRSTDFLDNYGFGGRFTTSKSPIMSQVLLPQNRPLNRFMYPEVFHSLSLDRRELKDPRIYNLPAFECPSDTAFNYTERSREARREPEYTQSAYYTTGTSYAYNVAWLGADKFFRYSAFGDPFTWEQGMRHFERARYAYPSRFVTYIDEPGNMQTVFRIVPSVPHHLSDQSYSTAYLDGHAALVQFDRNDPYNLNHTFLFPEQQYTRRDN